MAPHPIHFLTVRAHPKRFMTFKNFYWNFYFNFIFFNRFQRSITQSATRKNLCPIKSALLNDDSQLFIKVCGFQTNEWNICFFCSYQKFFISGDKCSLLGLCNLEKFLISNFLSSIIRVKPKNPKPDCKRTKHLIAKKFHTFSDEVNEQSCSLLLWIEIISFEKQFFSNFLIWKQLHHSCYLSTRKRLHRSQNNHFSEEYMKKYSIILFFICFQKLFKLNPLSYYI